MDRCETISKPFKVDDLLQLTEVDQAVFSSDGAFAAVCVKCPMTQRRMEDFPRAFGTDRSSVFLYRHPANALVPLSERLVPGFAAWSPLWSPDGKRLAMCIMSFDTPGPRILVWERETDTHRILPEQQPSILPGSVRWRSNQELIAITQVVADDMHVWKNCLSRTAMNWKARWQGENPSVTEFVSGLDTPIRTGEPSSVLLLDCDSGRSTILDTFQPYLFSNECWLSPTGEHVAYLTDLGTPQPTRETVNLLAHIHNSVELRVIDLNDGKVVTSQSNLVLNWGEWDVRSPLWSSSGNHLVFAGKCRGEGNESAHFVMDVKAGVVERRSLGLEGVQAIMWSGDSALLVKARWARGADEQPKRDDWFRVEGSGSPRNITHNLPGVPASLIAGRESDKLYGVYEGSVVEFTQGGCCSNEVDSHEGLKLNRLLHVGSNGRLLFHGNRDQEAGWISARIRHSVLTGWDFIPQPSCSQLLCSSASSGRLLISVRPLASESQVHLLEFDTPSSRRTVVHRYNSFLESRLFGEPRRIDYVSGDGKALTGWLLMPPASVRREPIPLITWVYPGRVYRPNPPRNIAQVTATMESVELLQLFATSGYGVLLPSMPIASQSGADEHERNYNCSVLPAIDKLTADGVVDPDALAIAGHSAGGCATYGFVGQTDRFKAAIVLAGTCDAIGRYGQFHKGLRCFPGAQASFASVLFYGTLQRDDEIDKVPWEGPEAFTQRSPLFKAGQVETPLLIVHGDIDSVGVEQAEEFFTALWRQGKPAKLLIYQGEEHWVQSPANVVHMWNSMLDWLAKWIGKKRTSNKTDAGDA